jgi:phosphoribosylglycinamide formyltransferase-1
VDRIAVLLSGRGSNFLAIHEAVQNGRLDAEIVCVLSNRPGAPGIERAREYGYAAHVVDHKAFANRAAHEEAVLRILDGARPDVIVLAGYMRLLSAEFVARYEGRILNIHPSLLPSFPGVDAQAQALAYGVKVTGCTVHIVTEEMDVGPILAQEAVPVLDGDTPETLHERIKEVEHRLYPETIRRFASQRGRIA